MPPFWPPQILFRLILGLLPVLGREDTMEKWAAASIPLYQTTLTSGHCLGESCLCYLLLFVMLHKPYLNSRVHVIVDIIVFKHTVAIVIEVNSNLLKWQWKYIGFNLVIHNVLVHKYGLFLYPSSFNSQDIKLVLDGTLWSHDIRIMTIMIRWTIYIPLGVLTSLWSDLLPAVYPVPPQHWRTARCNPHSCQCVAVHLILLNDSLSFFMLHGTETNGFTS